MSETAAAASSWLGSRGPGLRGVWGTLQSRGPKTVATWRVATWAALQ